MRPSIINHPRDGEGSPPNEHLEMYHSANVKTCSRENQNNHRPEKPLSNARKFGTHRLILTLVFFSFQSFFGRSYNNLSSISECKNNGECVINKKNRTACKACRLRKCLLVGMSKSGSRYGRRSNWFKIHCLLQEQQQAAGQLRPGQGGPPLPGGPPRDLLLEEYQKGISPESPHSEDDGRRRSLAASDLFMPLPFPGLPLPGFPPPMLPPPHLLFPGGFHQVLYPPRGLLKPATNNNNRYTNNNNNESNVESFTKRFYLDAVLKSQRSSPSSSSVKSTHGDNEDESLDPEELDSPRPLDDLPRPIPLSLTALNVMSVSRKGSASPMQENPMDLSMKSGSFSGDERRATPEEPEAEIDSESGEGDEGTDEGTGELFSAQHDVKRLKLHRAAPLDLTTKV